MLDARYRRRFDRCRPRIDDRLMSEFPSRASVGAFSTISLLAVLVLVLGSCRHGAEEVVDWRIVFTSDRGGEFALWSIRPDGSGLARIGAANRVPAAPTPPG